MALGASGRSVLCSVVAETVPPIAIGAVAGVVGPVVVAVGDVSERAFGLPGAGLLPTVGTVLVVLVVAWVLATWTPVRRALRISPRDALLDEA